jgi:hypothetical protein
MSCSFQRMSNFRIGRADTEYMSVRIVGRTNSALDNWEVNLVDVEVELAVGGFKGLFVVKLTLGHLAELRAMSWRSSIRLICGSWPSSLTFRRITLI